MNIDEGQETFDWTAPMLPLSEYKRILYVGMHPKTFYTWGGDYFLDRIKEHTPASCTVIEIEASFIEHLKAHPLSAKHNVEYIHSSIQDFLATSDRKFDCVIWWHGPEHLPKEDSLAVIQNFEKVLANPGIMILGCPLGHQPYEDGNDRHWWDVYEEDFQKLGYQTKLCDRWPRGAPPSISAAKVVK